MANEDDLEELVSIVLSEATATEIDFESATYIARLSGGVGNHFGFFYQSGQPPKYWVPASGEAFRIARRYYKSMTERPAAMAVILRLSPSTGRVDLNIECDEQATKWFVPIGHEDDLAEFAR